MLLLQTEIIAVNADVLEKLRIAVELGYLNLGVRPQGLQLGLTQKVAVRGLERQVLGPCIGCQWDGCFHSGDIGFDVLETIGSGRLTRGGCRL